MPLGGDEMHSGYKGYGLALAIDVLTGVLAGEFVLYLEMVGVVVLFS